MRHRRCKGSQTTNSAKTIPTSMLRRRGLSRRTRPADVLDFPVGGKAGEEGEGEVGGERGCPGSRHGGVRRVCGIEDSAIVEEAEEGRGVELTVLPEEGAVGGASAEGDAGGGDAGEVGWGGQAEEDLRQELVGDRQRLHFLDAMRPRQHARPELEGGRFNAGLALVRCPAAGE